MKMQKQRNLLCFCTCFAFLGCFFPGTTSALMRTVTRQQYLLYAPRTKAKKKRKNNAKIKRTNCENNVNKKVEKSDKHEQLHVFAFLFALPFAKNMLLYRFILATCIYGWRARLDAIAAP